ncbi:hypothetical protein YC2023_096594 [Brassica napus]
MATEQQAEVGRETSSASRRFSRNRDLYLFLPFLFSDQESSDGDHNVASWRERIILVNPFTQGMIVLEESSGLNPLLRDLLESREEEVLLVMNHDGGNSDGNTTGSGGT